MDYIPKKRIATTDIIVIVEISCLGKDTPQLEIYNKKGGQKMIIVKNHQTQSNVF